MNKLVKAVDTLSSLCRHSFGPCGEDTLLFQPPDPPVITTNGHDVLTAWKNGLIGNQTNADDVATQALMRFILDAVNGLYRQVGDGTTEFLLLLYAAIHHAVDKYLVRDTFIRGHFDQMQLSRAFGCLKWEFGRRSTPDYLIDFPDLLICTKIEVNEITGLPSKQFYEAMSNILRSSLNGVVNMKVAKFLVNLIIEWIFTPEWIHNSNTSCSHRITSSDLFGRIQQFLKRAPNAIIYAPSRSFYDSQILRRNEFILQKSFMTSQLVHTLINHRNSTQFICLTCPLSLIDGNVNHVIMEPPLSSSEEDIFGAYDMTRTFVGNYLRFLRQELQVQLIICTEPIEDHVVEICSRIGIACVQLAEKEDVIDLCTITQIFPVISLFDTIHVDRHIGVCHGDISVLRLHQTTCLHFHELSSRQKTSKLIHPQLVVPQLLMRAPTKGIYKQYYTAVIKALRVLRSWWERDSIDKRVLYSCRGGGATELAIAHWLQTKINAESIHDSKTMTVVSWQILQAALIEVVTALRSNLNMSCGCEESIDVSRKHSLRAMLKDMRKCKISNKSDVAERLELPLEGYIIDFNHPILTLAGPIQMHELVYDDPVTFGLIHPWKRIDALLFMLLETLERLFRIDTTLHISKKPNKQPDDLE